MSGGSLGYLYRKVEDAATEIRSSGGREATIRFANHLDLVAKALHDIEWELSNDYSEGDADAAIRAVIGPESLRNVIARHGLDITPHDPLDGLMPIYSVFDEDDCNMTEEEIAATEAEESTFDPEHPANTGL